MNFGDMGKPDTFVLVMKAMTDKLVEKELEVGDLRAHIAQHHEELDERQRTITDLRTQAEGYYDQKEELQRLRDQMYDLRYKADNYEALKRENDRLYSEARALRAEVAKLKYGGNTPTETANAYMKAHGYEVATKGTADYPHGSKIMCIKVVREITEWGLKETKDFVENYIATQFPIPVVEGGEETPSGTKRSSQIPAGVGLSARKSG